MNIQVTPHTITLTRNESINAGEYNITPCIFEFSEEYSNLTKEAVFSTCSNTVKTAILNNQCIIPFEVLQEPGNVLIGVFGYDTEDDELVLRYSPKPVYFNVVNGSFKEGNDPDLPSPTEWELVLEQINEAIEKTNNLNITVEKNDHITTITLTKKDGTQETVQIEDGKSLEFKWQGTYLGIRQEGQSEYQYVNLKGDKGDAGAIKMLIVNELPTTGEEDTIYLVPYTKITVQTLPTENIQLHTIYIIESTGKRYVYNGNKWIEISNDNQYIEYVYINNSWEELGSIGVDINLDDYYTKTETNTLLNDKVGFTDYASSTAAGVIKTNYSNSFSTNPSNGIVYCDGKTYEQYQSAGNGMFIGKQTLENVITGKDLTTKAYVDGLVGDINTALDTINGEVI